MAVKFVIECDNCGKQEPLQFSVEVVGDGSTMQQSTIMPTDWITYRQNDRIKHYCGVECLYEDIAELTIEEANDKQPPIIGMQRMAATWEDLRSKWVKVFG